MPKKQLEFFPFFVEPFLTATQSWPADRVGAYLLCLLYQWNHGSVPGDDIEELAVIMHETTANARRLWAKIGPKFPAGPNGYQNAKIEEVRADVKGRVDKKKQQTSAASNARWQRPGALLDGCVAQSVTETGGTASRNQNLESTKDLRTNPPLIPPASAVGSPSSVSDSVIEMRPTRAEREAAKRLYDEHGCLHDPEECESEEFCIGRLIGEARARERAGLRAGAA